MSKRISILIIILCFSITMAQAGGKWIYNTQFVTDTSIANQGFMFLASDSSGNLYASCYNSAPTTASINFYKVSGNWRTGSPTFLAFDTTTNIPAGRSEYGIAVDASGNVYGDFDNGVAASSYYKVWNSSLSPITTVLNPSSGRPTGIAVDEDVSNAKGRHLYHGDLVNGKIRVRNQLDQTIAGGSTFDQLKPGTFPRDVVIQPLVGNSTAYNLWVNFNGSILVFPNVSGRAIEADTGNVLKYAAVTVFTNPAPVSINDLGIAYDSVKNTIIFSPGTDTAAGYGQTIRIIKADTTNTLVQTLGTPGVGGNDNNHFTSPADGVTVDIAGKHYLAVSDLGNYRIIVYAFGIPVTPTTPQIIHPGQVLGMTADTSLTNGTVNWSLSTSGLGSLDTTQGANVIFTASTSAATNGVVTITATDIDGDKGTIQITVTGTAAPLANDADNYSVIRSEPVWKLME